MVLEHCTNTSKYNRNTYDGSYVNGFYCGMKKMQIFLLSMLRKNKRSSHFFRSF